jgi:hypothetical protein
VSPLSARVIGAATLVSSPALWQALVDRTLPLDVALTRYLIALVLCWAALSLVGAWAFPDPRAPRTPEPPAQASETADADAG